jgi:hypothetical protein
MLGAKLLWRRILCKETALLEGPLVWVGRLHGVVADSGARVPYRAGAADASRGRTRFRERTACIWLTSERHAPANRHPLFAAYSCHCHCRLFCPRLGTTLIVATQWLFVLYYRLPCCRTFSPKASMHAAKFRATRIQRIRLCAQPQRRLIQTAHHDRRRLRSTVQERTAPTSSSTAPVHLPAMRHANTPPEHTTHPPTSSSPSSLPRHAMHTSLSVHSTSMSPASPTQQAHPPSA